METERRFLWLAAAGHQAAHQVDEKIHRAGMARVLNLRDVFELVNNRLDNGAFPQQNLVEDRYQFVFHVRFDSNDELQVKIAQGFFKKWLRNMRPPIYQTGCAPIRELVFCHRHFRA